MENDTSINNTNCCPPFEPKNWDDKEFEWQDKKFIQDHIKTFWFMPLNFGPVMQRIQASAEAAGAKMPDYMCLSDHTSKWNMDVYLAVDKEVPDAKNVNISGKFISKVYDGPFKDTSKWCKDFEQYAKNKGYPKINKWYMWYTTCPKCAKKYGHNYVVIIGKVD